MDEKIWFYASQGEQKGPIDAAELDMLIGTDTIGPDTLIWRDGMTDWQPAAAALPDELMPSAWSRPATPPPPPPSPARDMTAPANTAQAGNQASPEHPTQMMDAVRTCFNKYASFRGRARRPEFWYFALFNFIAQLVLGLVDSMVFGLGDVSPLSNLYGLAVLVPSLAVGARRLHDTGRSGWWQLLVLIPLIGIIVLIVWWASRGNEGENEFGPA
ncbi:DUF805 domain-containing protein [Oricola nitratireducens]|uniref:DUF805 domain-containing protein n=1 Tax=Oricola nitratireducens TaxID=2775868 RepID=UPI0018661738|nr:DUF805 domain-containing protein [Oricola nitratireducens]